MGNMTRSARHRLLTVAYLGSLLWGSSLLIPLFFVPQAAAQSAAQSSWPQRPIRIMVGFGAGGTEFTGTYAAGGGRKSIGALRGS